MQREFHEATNGEIKLDRRNEQAKAIWDEIQTYAKKPYFAENMEALRLRRKNENQKLYNFRGFQPVVA